MTNEKDPITLAIDALEYYSREANTKAEAMPADRALEQLRALQSQPARGECPNSGKPCSCSDDKNCVTQEHAVNGLMKTAIIRGFITGAIIGGYIGFLVWGMP